MLKIKDNVKLEELEEYGFIKGFIHLKMHKQTITYVGQNKNIYINNSCWWNHEFYYCEGYDVIYDLIQAGLVEKVEE